MNETIVRDLERKAMMVRINMNARDVFTDEFHKFVSRNLFMTMVQKISKLESPDVDIRQLGIDICASTAENLNDSYSIALAEVMAEEFQKLLSREAFEKMKREIDELFPDAGNGD